jgi:hypothetical protein
VCQSQRVPQFVQSNTEYVEIAADTPGFGIVEVNIAGQGLGRDRRWPESVGQDAARPVERKSVPMISLSEQEVNGLVGCRAGSRKPVDLSHRGPVRHGAEDFSLGGRFGQLSGQMTEEIGEVDGVQAGTVPTVPRREDVLI